MPCVREGAVALAPRVPAPARPGLRLRRAPAGDPGSRAGPAPARPRRCRPRPRRAPAPRRSPPPGSRTPGVRRPFPSGPHPSHPCWAGGRRQWTLAARALGGWGAPHLSGHATTSNVIPRACEVAGRAVGGCGGGG